MSPRRPVALLALAMTACHPAPTTDCGDCAAYEAELGAWREQRLAELKGEQGWLALAGLHWLQEGEQRLGADASADMVFPAGAPAEVGTLTLRGAEVTLRVAAGVTATLSGAPVREQVLRTEATPPADRVQIGDRFRFHVIDRGGALAVRLYDLGAPARRELTAIDAFPVRGAWRIRGRFEAYAQRRTIDHPTVLGTVQPAEVPGVAVFEVAGQELRLTPIVEAGPHGEELLFVFRDRTSGDETYAGGRFLIAAMPVDGAVLLDFNRAHNPPCAFTPYATCPLPLPENRLPVRVEAGERTPPH